MDKNDTVSLKEHFEKILAEKDKYFERILLEKDKALNAALVSSDKRLDLLNELRMGVATKDELRALEKIVEDLRASRDKGEGKGQGSKDVIDIIKLVIIIAGFLLAYFVIKK